MTEYLLIGKGVDVFGQPGFHIRCFIPVDDFLLGSLINNGKNIIQFGAGVGLAFKVLEFLNRFFHCRGYRPVSDSVRGRCAYPFLARFVMWQTKTLSYLII